MEPILIATLNRPEVKIACDSQTAQELNAAIDLLDSGHGLFLGMITGAGGNFSTGANLKEVARRGEGKTLRGVSGVFVGLPRKPLNAAVEGVAVGGGLEPCRSCDIIVAARNVRMAMREVRRNVASSAAVCFVCRAALLTTLLRSWLSLKSSRSLRFMLVSCPK